MMESEPFPAPGLVQLAKLYLHHGSVLFATYWRMLLGIAVFLLLRWSLIAAFQGRL